jgi:carboxypeptidase C (cathepsin A)
MIFVEQPGGTGFSTASSAWTGEEAEKRTEDDVAESFYAFLQNLYTVFGDELAEKKLFVTGESYAGMYIPSIARGIYLGNKNIEAKSSSSSPLHFIDIKGVAIGNGWIDVDTQGPSLIDYAWWHHMIDLPTRRLLREKWDDCITGKITDSSDKPFHSFTAPSECGFEAAILAAAGTTFQYDVTTYDAYPAIMGENGIPEAFFNNKEVQKALNVKQEHWQQCVPGSGRRRLQEKQIHRVRQLIMLDQDRRSVLPWIAELLDDAGIDVLVYNGDLDLSCNSQGTELALEAMDWSGKEDWKDPQVTKWFNWFSADQPAGHAKRYKNLEFLVVYNSGHFVPTNQAEHALDMIGRLLDGKSFQDVELPRLVASKKVTSLLGKDSTVTATSSHRSTVSSSLVWTPIGVTIGFILGAVASYVIVVLFPRHRHGHGYQELRSVNIN